MNSSGQGAGNRISKPLATVNDGNNNTAGYSYLANSPLVSQIAFINGTTRRMATTKTYDYLNRLTQISNAPSAAVAVNFNYTYNTANQRTKNTLVDGSYWIYQYDTLGQVTGGTKYFADGTLVPGQQFGYQFDDIGNRKQTTAGGDASGVSLRPALYTVNNLNQITARDYPGTNDVLGAALATNVVTVNGQTAWRKGEYFWATVKSNNTASAQWEGIKIVSGGNTNNGNLYVPKTPEQFTYDADGNLTNDGRWAYTWDAENRLIQMTVNLNVGPQYQLTFAYDAKGRRIQKLVATNGVALSTNNFLYDGWNLIAETRPDNSLIRSYVWGTDLSGTSQGAGGVGGLLEISYYGSSTTNCFPAYDGNGNIMALVNAADGTLAANYDYAAFGEPIRITGVMARNNPFRFSTKYTDDESDLHYYGYRYYKPSTGTWLSKDPWQEQGGLNLYGFVADNPISGWDRLGLTEWGDVIPGWWDAAWDGLDWATGHSGTTDYGPDSLQSREMSSSSIAGQIRDAFLKKNKDKPCKDWKGISNVTTKFRVFHELIYDAFNGTAEFVGRARGDVVAKKDLVNCKIKAEFNLMNATDLTSLLYGLWPNSWNVTLPGFPAANWTQFYKWNETFDCNCCGR